MTLETGLLIVNSLYKNLQKYRWLIFVIVQVACDVIQSEGIIGGPYVPLDKQKKPVDLIFCNPDLIWRADFDRPRIGQGGFKVAFQAVFKVNSFLSQDCQPLSDHWKGVDWGRISSCAVREAQHRNLPLCERSSSGLDPDTLWAWKPRPAFVCSISSSFYSYWFKQYL